MRWAVSLGMCGATVRRHFPNRWKAIGLKLCRTAFEMVWKKSVGRKAVRADGTKNETAEAALGIVFAVVSAGFGALVSQLSGRGSKAIVDRRHARQAHRK